MSGLLLDPGVGDTRVVTLLAYYRSGAVNTPGFHAAWGLWCCPQDLAGPMAFSHLLDPFLQGRV